jgi:hypothetical protein
MATLVTRRLLLALCATMLAPIAVLVQPERVCGPVCLDPDSGSAVESLSALGSVRLNEIQVVGSHNSYHRRPEVELYAMVDRRARAWDYHHPPLPEQLDAGFRAFELDVFVDDEGGRYARPLTIRGRGHEPEFESPGFKVLHVPDLDQGSNCPRLEGCLMDLAAWSAANPAHLPIVVMLECMSFAVGDRLFLDFAEALPWERRHVAALESLVRSTLGDERLITPDMVRGRHATLADAIRSDGWPEVESMRGRVLFVLTEDRHVAEELRTLHPRLEGSALFGQFGIDDPDASLVVLNDPLAQWAEIARAVARGLLVRTRADADLREARDADTARRDAAIGSGAQVISTDVLAPRTRYSVRMPCGGIARISPRIAGDEAGRAIAP